VPKDEYIQKAIEAASVVRYLEKSRYRKPVFLITGVKTVTGAKSKTAKKRGGGGNVSAEVDGTMWSSGTVPVGGGPEFEIQRENVETTEWSASSDFVFAFRVRKVVVARETGQAEDDDYTRGASLAYGRVREKAVSIVMTANVETGADEVGFDQKQLEEGEDMVLCAVPRGDMSL
jgi:hypothetical protein